MLAECEVSPRVFRGVEERMEKFVQQDDEIKELFENNDSRTVWKKHRFDKLGLETMHGHFDNNKDVLQYTKKFITGEN